MLHYFWLQCQAQMLCLGSGTLTQYSCNQQCWSSVRHRGSESPQLYLDSSADRMTLKGEDLIEKDWVAFMSQLF